MAQGFSYAPVKSNRCNYSILKRKLSGNVRVSNSLIQSSGVTTTMTPTKQLWCTRLTDITFPIKTMRNTGIYVLKHVQDCNTGGSRDGALVRVFPSHQFAPDSIPGLGVIWVEFVVVGSRPCSERFISGYSGFPLLINQHF